jgi:DNA-binding XRE family transcriptional regulator
VLVARQEEVPTQAARRSWLLLFRQHHRLSQRDVANALAVTERTLRHWENNPENEPKLNRFQWQALRKLCQCMTQEDLEALIEQLIERPI